VSPGTNAIRLLEHTKFTQSHGRVSFRILMELKISVVSGVRKLLFDMDKSRAIIAISFPAPLF
jgi:hypothetical protein